MSLQIKGVSVFIILMFVCTIDVWAKANSGEPQSPGVYSHEVVLPTPEPVVEELEEEAGKAEVVETQKIQKVEPSSEWPNSHVKDQYEVLPFQDCNPGYTKGVRFWLRLSSYWTMRDQCLLKSHLSIEYDVFEPLYAIKSYSVNTCADGYLPGGLLAPTTFQVKRRYYKVYARKKCYLRTSLPDIYEIDSMDLCANSHEKVYFLEKKANTYQTHYQCMINTELLGKLYLRWQEHSEHVKTFCATGYTPGVIYSSDTVGKELMSECLHINSLGSLYEVDDGYKCAPGYADGRRYERSDIERAVKECRKL